MADLVDSERVPVFLCHIDQLKIIFAAHIRPIAHLNSPCSNKLKIATIAPGQPFCRFPDCKTEIAVYLCACTAAILIFVRKIVHNPENKIDPHHRLPILCGQPKVIIEG